MDELRLLLMEHIRQGPHDRKNLNRRPGKGVRGPAQLRRLPGTMVLFWPGAELRPEAHFWFVHICHVQKL